MKPNMTQAKVLGLLMGAFLLRATAAMGEEPPSYEESKRFFDSGTPLAIADIPTSGIAHARAVGPDSSTDALNIVFSRNDNVARIAPVFNSHLSDPDAVRDIYDCDNIIPPAVVDSTERALTQWFSRSKIRAIDADWQYVPQGMTLWRWAVAAGKKKLVGRYDIREPGWSVFVGGPQLTSHYGGQEEQVGYEYLIADEITALGPSSIQPSCNGLVSPCYWAGVDE